MPAEAREELPPVIPAFSITVTFLPSWAIWIAEVRPAPPAPTITVSVVISVSFPSLSSLATRSAGLAPAFSIASFTADKNAAEEIVAPEILSRSVVFWAITLSLILSRPWPPTAPVSFSSTSIAVISPFSIVTFTLMSPP